MTMDHGARQTDGRFRGWWESGWFVVPYHVMFRDLDAFGHVNNAVYFTYFEWARTQLWFELTGGGRAEDIGFIVAHADCDFRQQIGLEPIEIAVRVGDIRNSSLDFHSTIRKSGGLIAAEGKVVAVMYDWVHRQKIAIPPPLRERIAALQT